jgi:cytochrome b561
MSNSTPADPAARGYEPVAMGLHWLIAALIIVQIGLGWWMNEVLPDHSPAQAQVEGVHVSLGLTILVLVLIRIAWRLTHRPPPLPAAMAGWERLLAATSHILFYLLMLALPLTGWATVSLHDHPIYFWGLPWPRLPGLSLFVGSMSPHEAHETISHIHVYILIWIILLNLALHVAGALKHQFDGVPVLWRMTGGRPPAAR